MMKRQVSMTEIEEMIKEKLRKNGVFETVGEEKISEIKEKVRSIIKSKKLDEADAQAPPVQTPVNAGVETQNPNITVKTTQDPQRTELAKKEAEIELREKQMAEKEAMISQKEAELDRKIKELSYKPELPQKIQDMESGELIVFSENELSLGTESLSERKLRMRANPDQKVSPHDLWLKDAKTKSNVYLVELKHLGQLVFDPYNGTTVLERSESSAIEPAWIGSGENETCGTSPIESQMPKEKMIDGIEPIKDVIQPIANPGPPEPAQSLEQPDFKEMIEKIVQDQLTRKNNYSLGPGPAGQGVY